MNKITISWIDSMKGIAMCGVIMTHLGGANLPSIYGHIGNVGRNGVQIFFLLSAYLTFVSLHKISEGNETICTDRTYYRNNILIWWKKKFIKLIPIYYLMLIVCFVFEGGSSFWLGSEVEISFFNILSHALFLHGLFPHFMDSIIGVEWYLGVLAILYILAPMLYKYINSLERAISTFVVSVPICYLIKKIAYNFVPMVEDKYIYIAYIDTFGFIAQLPVILLGIILFFAVKRIDIQKIKEKKIISYSLLCFAILMILGQMYQENNLFMVSVDTLFGIWFFCVALSQNIYNTSLIDNIVFRIIGRYSYPIYLLHFFLINLLQKILDFNVENDILNFGIQYFIIICVSLGISYILEKYYNKPIIEWLEKYLISNKE